MEPILKPCPFCGSKAAFFEDIRYKVHPLYEYFVYGVRCTNKNCIMHGNQQFYMNEESAADAWNKRSENSESRESDTTVFNIYSDSMDSETVTDAIMNRMKAAMERGAHETDNQV